MADYYYTSDLSIAEIPISETAILLFSYRSMWDRGNRLMLLILDPDASLHAELEGKKGTPTLPITFQLEWKPSTSSSVPYKNKGSKRTLYVQRIGQVSTPQGLAIRILAVDLATLLLTKAVTSYHAINAKASTFIEDLCKKLGVRASIIETSDNADKHRAHNVTPIDHIRYELDRTLSKSGKPITLQYDDRVDQQKLIGLEEPYGDATTLVGTYDYGVSQVANGAKGGHVIYHYESDINFAAMLMGHTVTAQQLTFENGMIDALVKPKLTGNLGIDSDLALTSKRRITVPHQASDAANQDDFVTKAILTNAAFHSEMSVSSGMIVIDTDFAAYDDPAMLNRKHVVVSITGASNAPSKNSIIPKEAVVMGFNHVLTRESHHTRVFIRRGK